MSNYSISDVKTGLRDTLAEMTTANGYNTELREKNIRGVFDARFIDNTQSENVPRVTVTLDMGAADRLVAGNMEERINLMIIFQARVTDHSPLPVTEQCERFIDDLRKLIASNQTLRGSVHSCELAEWTTDQGVRAPEGVVVAYISTLRFVR